LWVFNRRNDDGSSSNKSSMERVKGTVSVAEVRMRLDDDNEL
jgi:hypothetical protein